MRKKRKVLCVRSLPAIVHTLRSCACTRSTLVCTLCCHVCAQAMDTGSCVPPSPCAPHLPIPGVLSLIMPIPTRDCTLVVSTPWSWSRSGAHSTWFPPRRNGPHALLDLGVACQTPVLPHFGWFWATCAPHSASKRGQKWVKMDFYQTLPWTTWVCLNVCSQPVLRPLAAVLMPCMSQKPVQPFWDQKG